MNSAAPDGLTSSAILLLSIGEDQAAEVFKHLSPKEVQKLGQAMARLENVTREQVDAVIENFTSEAGQQVSLSANSDEYVRNVISRALGDEKANLLIDRIVQVRDTTGIQGLKWMDAATVAELIQNEHPQIIASILVHLDADQAAGIVKIFSERLRTEVMLRIATLDGIQPAALRELNDVLAKLLSGSENLKKSALGGVRAAADILNFVGASLETATVEAIRTQDADLAQKILDEMFVFDNLLDLDDRGIQMILREVQSESLIVALKGSAEPMREKIFKNMSSRAAEMLREDLESKGPVRISEVEAEQKEILKVARRLAEEGQIVLGGGGGDDGFV
ncbi:MAG: flagellar motor switch protein FliG [Burkholderiales bacterium]